MISSIKIKGFRGFAEEQELTLSKPNGDRGSGLTIIIGPNNGGKSTIIESFKLMSSGNDISFAEGQRNKAAGSRVKIVLSSYDGGPIYTLETIPAGGHKAKRNPEFKGGKNPDPSITVLSSRRFFNPYSKEASHGNGPLLAARAESVTLETRGTPIDADDNGLFEIIENPKSSKEFNNLLKQILGYNLNWTVDLSNTGDYYVKINNNHDSDGLGEGLVSLLFLVEALLNSSSDKLVVIDEPELSLHPQLQRNLLEIILEKSRDRQILYATHSPEMILIEAITNGGALARVVNSGDGSKIYQLNDESRESLEKFEGDLFNPHVLGYDARSCFFADDLSAGLVVVEGQEDVIFLKKALEDLYLKRKIRFFGFGASGAGKIEFILAILKNLGFKKVCCLYDGDIELKKIKEVQGKFPQYGVEILNADDIRDKECRVYDKCSNLLDGKRCKNCKDMKQGIEFCLNKCGNVVNKKLCESCEHMKIGIFNNKKEIKDKYKPEFESLLDRISKKYEYE